MEFFAAILFLLLYFVRLHDWVPFLAGFNVVKPAMALGVFGFMTREPRTPGWKFMGTPHEWVMVIYLATCVYLDPDWYETLLNILPLAGFYFLTAYSLNTEQRLAKFFGWWCFCIVFMAAVGTLTVAGIDITGAEQGIVTNMGRLVLNTYLMDNPNSLGHTLVTGIPLIYLMMMFRRGMGLRFLAIPFFIVVGVCVISTESKGAYFSGAAGIAAALLVGRKLWTQVIVTCVLVLAAYVFSSMLPRMMDRESLRHDEGVMGRVLAFDAARTAYKTAPAGWRRFDPVIKWEGQDVSKATHSSFVQVGADLGPKGLFLYLSMLCCAMRSLLLFPTESDDLERCRRLLFALIFGFAVSGWMINRSYHAEYFLLLGAATAYHRLALEHLRGIVPEFGGQTVLKRAPPAGEEGENIAQAVGEPTDDYDEETAPKRRFWNRYGIVDFGIAYTMLVLTVWLWDYVIENI